MLVKILSLIVMDCVSGCTMDIVLDGTAIGDNLDCNWSVGSRNSTISIRTRWPANGVHEYTLTCIDESGVPHSDSIIITIIDDADLYPTFNLDTEFEFIPGMGHPDMIKL